MLGGRFQHNIDAKGRVILPAKIREEIGDTFVMTRGLDGALFIFSMEEWEKLKEKLFAVPLSQGRDIVRHFFGSMAECELDKQGRLLIPQNLREEAKIAKDVVFMGLGTRAEIWAKDVLDERESKFKADDTAVALQMEELGI